MLVCKVALTIKVALNKIMTENEYLDEIAELIHSLFRIIRKTGFEAWREVDLTMPQLKTLMMISCKKEVKSGKLADIMQVKAPNITFILDQLEEKGLIERMQTPDDRRVVLAGITKKGEKLLEELSQLKREILKNKLSGLEKGQMKKIKSALKTLIKAYDTSSKN